MKTNLITIPNVGEKTIINEYRNYLCRRLKRKNAHINYMYKK